MALVFGIGAGLFILIVIWTTVIAVSFIVMKQRGGGVIIGSMITVSLLTTLILILLPRGDNTSSHGEEVDGMFIARMSMIAGMMFSVVVGGVFVLLFRCIEPVYAKRQDLRFYDIYHPGSISKS